MFYRTLSELVDHHVPLTKLIKKEITLHSKPSINKVIKHFVPTRMKLKNSYYKKNLRN